MKKQLLILTALFISIISYSQSVGDLFVDNGLLYEITSITPNTAQINSSPTVVGVGINIPAAVDHNSDSYSVTSIKENAFLGKGYTSLTIPNSIISIGSGAFFSNPLTCIISEAVVPPSINSSATDPFGPARNTIDLSIPSGTASAYVTGGWTGFNSVAEGLTGTFVVNNITYQINATPNNEVTAIDYNTAGGTVVDIPDTVSSACIVYSVISIGNSAFANNQLTSVTIPDSVINIDANAFNNNDINNVVIGNSVVTIGLHAFIFNDLPNVTIPDSVISIGDGAFAQNNNMQTLVLGNSVETIGEYAFRFNSLNSVTIPDSVTSIGQLAFGSNSISTLVIGSGITSITNDVFGFNQITDIIIPDNITSIGDSAFGGNQNVNSIVIGNNVTTIDNLAFTAFPSQVTSITIPASVTTIGENAFAIQSLTDITTLATTPPTIITGGAYDTFNTYRSNINLYVPVGTTAAYVTDSGALWTGFLSVTEGVLSTPEFALANNIKVINSPDSLEIIANNTVKLENYTIYSITGAKVKEGEESTISITSLSNGIYILKLDFDKGTLTKKVIVN